MNDKLMNDLTNRLEYICELQKRLEQLEGKRMKWYKLLLIVAGIIAFVIGVGFAIEWYYWAFVY